jgi:hypothetical protein
LRLGCLALGILKTILAIPAIPAILAISNNVVLFLSLQDNPLAVFGSGTCPERARFYNPAVHPCRMLLAVKRECDSLDEHQLRVVVEKECSRVVRAFEPKLDWLSAEDHVLRRPAA